MARVTARALISPLALQEEINLAARRVSLAPVNRANIQSRSMSWRTGSLHWGRFTNEGIPGYSYVFLVCCAAYSDVIR